MDVMIELGFKIDTEVCATTFDVGKNLVKFYIKEKGLSSWNYKREYDMLFGKNAWNKGNDRDPDPEYSDDDFFREITEGGYDSDDI